MKLLKRMYLVVSNLPSDEEAVELPEDLTVEKMVTVVAAFFKASNDVLETVVQELLAKVRCTFVSGDAFKTKVMVAREAALLYAKVRITSLGQAIVEPSPGSGYPPSLSASLQYPVVVSLHLLPFASGGKPCGPGDGYEDDCGCPGEERAGNGRGH